jgi:lysozyme
MNLSSAGLALLKRSEGFRAQVYTDATGNPTIGYGHKLLHPESFPAGIDETFAAQILSRDVAEAEVVVSHLVKVPLNQGQFDALVDFVFNLGGGRLAGSTLLLDLNKGYYNDAAAQLLRWDHAGMKELPALKLRRIAEFQLWYGKQPHAQGPGNREQGTGEAV